MASLDPHEVAYLSQLVALGESISELSYVVEECMCQLGHFAAQEHANTRPLIILNDAEVHESSLRAHDLAGKSFAPPGRNYCVVQNINLPLMVAMGIAWNIEPEFFLKFMMNRPDGNSARPSKSNGLASNEWVVGSGASSPTSSLNIRQEYEQLNAHEARSEREKSDSKEDQSVHEQSSATSALGPVSPRRPGNQQHTKDTAKFGTVVHGHFTCNRQMTPSNWIRRSCSVGDGQAGSDMHRLENSIAYYATPDLELFLVDDAPDFEFLTDAINKAPDFKYLTEAIKCHEDTELWLETLECANHVALRTPIRPASRWHLQRVRAETSTSELVSTRSYMFDTFLQSVLRTANSEPQRHIRRQAMHSDLWPRFVVDFLLSLWVSGSWRQAYRTLKREIHHLSFVEIKEPDVVTHEKLHAARKNLSRLRDCVTNMRETWRLLDDEHQGHIVDEVSTAFGEKVSVTSVTAREWNGVTQPGWSRLKVEIEALETVLYQSFHILLSSIAVKESQLSTEEARRNMQQSRRGMLLTWLAFVYAPLSFITGIFGMNVREINGSTPPFWTAVLGIPVILVVTLALFGTYELWEQWRLSRRDKLDSSPQAMRLSGQSRNAFGKDPSKLV